MTQPTPKRRIPWLKLALAASLVVNFVALGMVWGIATRSGPSGSLLRASVAALPAEERRALRRETGAIWREARGAWRGADGPARQMITALKAPDFDAEAFSGALRQAQDRVLRISDRMHDKLLEKVTAMTPQQRRAYAEDLSARLEQRRWRAGRDPARRPEAAD